MSRTIPSSSDPFVEPTVIVKCRPDWQGRTGTVHGRTNKLFPFRRNDITGYHEWTCPLSKWQAGKGALMRELLEQPQRYPLMVDFEPAKDMKEAKKKAAPPAPPQKQEQDPEDTVDRKYRDPAFSKAQLEVLATSVGIETLNDKPISKAKKSDIVKAIDAHYEAQAKRKAEAQAAASAATEPGAEEESIIGQDDGDDGGDPPPPEQ